MAQETDWEKGALSAPQSETVDWERGKISEPAPRGLKGWGQDVAATAVKGAIAVPEAVVGLADLATGGRAGKFLENEGGAVGFRPKQAREIVNDWHSDATLEAQRKFQQADGIVDKAVTAVQNPSLIATAIGESLPAMGAGGVAARGLMAGTRLGQMGAKGAALAGAAGEGLTMAGSAAEQIRQETDDGLLTPGQAALAGATGVVGGAVGAVGGRVAQRLGIGDAETMLAQGQRGMAQQFATDAAGAAANPLQQQAVKSIPRQVIEGAISEGLLEELPQSVAEQIFQNIALDKPWHEDVDSAIVLGTLSGGAMGGGAAGYHAFARPRGAAPADVSLANEGDMPAAPQTNPGLDRVRQAFADQLRVLQEQEQGEALGPQSAPPDGAAALASQRAAAAVQRQADIEASRAVEGPDDEIYQSTGAEVPRSVRMGINPADGPLSTGAAMAVDTGVSDQMQQAAALAQAAEAAEKGGAKSKDKDGAGFVAGQVWGKPGRGTYTIESVSAGGKMAVADFGGGDKATIHFDAETANGWRADGAGPQQKQEQPAQNPLGADPETGEIPGPDAVANWSDAQLSEVFRGAQSRDVRLKLAQELSRRKAARAAEQSTIPKGTPDGAQATQAQQAGAQAAPAGPAQATTAAAGAPAQGALTRAGTTTADAGAQATAAAGAQAAAESTEQRAQRIDRAGAAWTRMPTVERQALAGRLDGVKAVLAKNLHGAAWENLNSTVKLKMADLIEPASLTSQAPAATNSGVDPVAARALTDAAHEAATSSSNDLAAPTAAQIEAGNYKKGHARVAGLDISIENPAGSRRRPEWPPLQNHYGYIRGSKGADKDHVDVFMTDRANDTALPVFVVDQNNADGTFDEHKVVMGAADEAEARSTYLGNYAKGWTGLGAITQMSQDEFKAWVRDPAKTARPAAKKIAASADAPSAGVDSATTRAASEVTPASAGVPAEQFAAGWWDVGMPMERERALLGAGWKRGSPATAELSGKRWAEIKPAQQQRLVAAIEAMRTAPAAPAPMSPKVAQVVNAAMPEGRARSKDAEPDAGRPKAKEAAWSDAEEKALLGLIGRHGGVVIKDMGGHFFAEVAVSNNDTKGVRATGKTSLDAKRALLKKLADQVPVNDAEPAPAVPAAAQAPAASPAVKEAAKPAPGNGIVGRRADGVMIRQDERGVRWYTQDGVRHAETVSLRPTRQGMQIDRGELKPEFMTAEETAARIDGNMEARSSAAQNDTSNATPVPSEQLPAERQARAAEAVAPGDGDPQSVDDGVAQARAGAAGSRAADPVADRAGSSGADSVQRAREQAPGAARDRGAVRPEQRSADPVAAQADPATAETSPKPELDQPGDHTIDAADIGKGGLGKKYRENIEAIRIIKAMAAEGRTATPAERKAIARYVGWGALKGVFDKDNKQWSKEFAELRELLTDAEYKAARASTLNAHFTSPEVVGGIFQALDRMGFQRGRVLEPSVGVGNFFGLMPASMRKASQLHGVELDPLTSQIAAALYPSAKIAKATGFQDFEVPGGYFDLAIGNPPFGSEPIVDDARSPYSGASIHNYFFAKSIDKLRPGGLLAMVVSHNFLDAKTETTRRWIADRAHLVAAVRLPNTAFKENAGTEVVTDIVVFQRKTESEQANGLGDDDWVKAGTQSLADAKTGAATEHNVSQYFLDNPANVLGTPTAAGSMYRAGEYTVEPTGKLADQLKAWADALPAGIYQAVERTHEPEAANVAVPDGVKVGSFFVDDAGKVQVRGDDALGERTATAWIPPNAKASERMKGMIGLRDGLRTQMRLERSPDSTDAEIEAARTALNASYDAFKKSHGYLNDPTNRRIFLDDTESALLLALEFDYDRGVSKSVAEREDIDARAPSAIKADIFQRRVMFPPADNIKVSNARDALLASLNYKGALDLPYMAQLYDKPQAEIVAELGDVVFTDPVHGTVMADEYLSGDVKTKLAEAEAAALDNADFKRNVEALKKVIPADKKPSEIHAAMGANFIPAEYFQQFAKEVTGADATVGYVKATGQWLVNFTGEATAALDAGKWGIAKMPARSIFIRTMAGQGVVVTETYKDGEGKTVTRVLEKETAAAREKQAAMKAEWQRWLWADPDRADALAGIYNEKMNRIVPRKYDGSHMTFPGMSPAMELLPHQKNAVWRALQSRQVLFDHVVGAGKTFEVVALFMEMRRLGIARKPFIAVPNHLTLQWRSEFSRLYPAANVLAATPDDFAKGNREKFFSKIVTGDWDAVIVGHSSLKKIALPAETEKAILQEQVDEISAAIEEMKRGRGDRNIVRDMEGIKARLQGRMKERLQALGNRDKVVDFSDLGVDAFAVDELHEFKNLFYNSTMERVPGMGNPSGSDKAFDLFVKMQWMLETYGDKAPIAGATGTPVSNSLVEMFNMQRFLQYPTLKRDGLHVFDAWAKQFGSVESLYEVSPSGTGYRQSSRFSKFKNLPALMANYQTFADTVTLDDLKAQEEGRGKAFPVPKIAGGRPVNVVAKRSPQVANFMGVPQLDIEGGKVRFGFDATADTVTITPNDDGTAYNIVATGTDAGGAPLNYSLGSAKTEEDARLSVVEAALSPKIKVDPNSILGQFADLKRLNKETKGKVNALSLTGQANKAGLDYRLIDPSAPDFEGSKINLAVNNMVATYHRTTADRGAQLVFCDLSVPLSARSGFAGKERRVYVRDQGALVHKKGTLHTVPGQEQLPFFVVKESTQGKNTFAVYDAATGLRLFGNLPAKGIATDWAAQTLNDDAKRQRWIDARDALGDIEQDAIDDYNNANEIDVEETEAIGLADIAGSSGAQGFSVYDDIKAKLIARGVPEREIAFIHDYGTPIAKDKLFKQVKRGDVRFLLGSTAKMGAGTNVQDRLVGLHHIDAPWRPSDLEQREGRIIRRGNVLYMRDPSGFEVEIYRYATEQTYDTRRWQILEHKARGIEQLRNYDGTLNEIDDIEGEAANSADMKAAASGDPLILEETQLRNDVRRLEALQASHADENASMVRRARYETQFAEKDGPQYLAQMQELKAVADAHPVPKDDFVGVTVGGKRIRDREQAIKAMGAAMQRVLTPAGSIEHFTYRGLDFTLEGNESRLELNSPTGNLELTRPQVESLPSMAGALTRFANYINRLPAHIADLEAKIADAKVQAKQLREQAAVPFEQAKDLDTARDAHKAVQRRLIAKGPDIPVNQRAQLKKAMEAQRTALREKGFGEALDEFLGNRPDAAHAGVRRAAASTGTPTDRAVMGMVSEGAPARDILRLVAGTSRSTFNRQLARLLLNTGITPKVTLEQGDMGGGDGFTFLAKYSRKNDALTLTPGAAAQAEQIVMHELVHAATLRALDRKGLASIQMRHLFDHVQKQGGAAGQYGMKNVGEFVAEAFTNPAFQQSLRGMKAPSGGTLKTAWDGFVRILRGILGLHQDSTDALSRALELGVAVMREDMGLRQRGVAGRGADANAGIAQTESPEFRRWFGDSKVVDTEGRPLVVYHGTNKDFDGFDTERGGELGSHFGNAQQAGKVLDYWFAKGRPAGAAVLPVYLSITNPIRLKDNGYFGPAGIGQQLVDAGVVKAAPTTNAEARAALELAGYDGVVYANSREGGGDSYIAFRPEQIKSAIGNNGSFDPEDADISHFGTAADFDRLKTSALTQIHQTLSHPGKVSLWDKTVGTMRNLAERMPAFKPVFESAQRFIDDVSMLGNDAADQAPRLLPRVDSWRDLTKKPITAADNKAIAQPLFEGTLMWARDVDGKPALVDDLAAKYAHLSADEKAQIMLRANRIDPKVLAMWKGMPLSMYESSVNSSFNSRVLKAGVVWTAKELVEMFGLDANQVSLYQEGRAAIDRSIDMTARADMLRSLGEEYAGMRDAVLAQETMDDAVELLTRTLMDDARDRPDMADRLTTLNNGVVKAQEKAQQLMDQGYAPLSRFGRYTVDVVDAAGERQYFGMFETMREANQMALRMKAEFQGAAVTQGTMSQDAFKLFAGVTPESLEMFGSMLGLDGKGDDPKDKAFQAYLQLAKNNHSALKRLIHRKGIAGYSEDVGRVLASFVYSNARLGAGGLNAGTMENAINAIPKEEGELKDLAMGLRDYIANPQEEGQAVRGMLFAQYLGGSLASAFVNMTQPFAVTLPWLTQFGGARKAGAQMAKALNDMRRSWTDKGFKYEADLAAALQSAEDDGVVSPQEIHQLMAQARGTGSLRTGDGTKAGDARAAAANNWERVKVAWGQPFALAEQFNRRSTFIAAYRIAKEQGMAEPSSFARKAVLETQFLYSKANKMRFARGAVGGTLMTFKTYSVSYLELMHRMWTQGGPEGKKAVGWAIAMLLLMSGAGGLPFMEDAEDLIDGGAQLMGYNLSAKQWRKQLLQDVVGKEFAEFMEQGISGLPGAPVDIGSRLGMQNLIPGTGLFLSKQNRERDLLEVAGPAGDLVARGFTAGRKVLTGDVGGAALELSPTAVRNMVKGADMAASGIYKDTKGYKVIDTTLAEAGAKFLGFQPKSVAEVQEANSFMQRTKSFYTQTSSEIKAQWADALFRKDEADLERVRERLADWNANNPDQPIVVKMPDVWKRVREMGKDRTQRIAETAPKALREQMREISREQRGGTV